ncbi:MAG: hypothetical protein R3D84_15300 [Paracoccaceae bacterium]
MIALLRLAVFGFIAMSVAYFAMRIYFRSTRREELEKEWDAQNAGANADTGTDGAETPERDAYIEAGMKDYEGSLRRKLIWLVYVIPSILIFVLIYLTNYS